MSKTRVRPWHRLLAIWLPVAALTLVLATLPNPLRVTPAAPALDTPAAAGNASLRAFIDPETGALSSQPAPRPSGKTLMPALNRSSEGLTPKTLPDGTVMVNLQGRFQNASLARIDAKGVLHTICTEDLQNAKAFLNDGSPRDEGRGAGAPTSLPMEVK